MQTSDVTEQVRRLKEIAEFEKTHCKACGKARYYIVAGQQVEHTHTRKYKQRDERDALEEGPFTAPEDIPEYQEMKQRIFSLTIGSLDLFTRVVKTVKLYNEEGSFVVSPAGLTYRAMDPSHVCLIDATIAPDVCERYNVPAVGKVDLRIADLDGVLARGDKNQGVSIGMDDTLEPDLVSVGVYAKSGRKKQFGVRTIEGWSGSAPLPKVDFDVDFTITTDGLLDVLNDMAAVSDQVAISSSGKTVTFSSRSDLGKAETSFDTTDPDLVEIFCQGSGAKSTYAIDYIANTVKALCPKGTLLRVRFSSRKPLLLTYILGDTRERSSYVDFWLAARVSDSYDAPRTAPAPPETEESDEQAIPEHEAKCHTFEDPDAEGAGTCTCTCDDCINSPDCYPNGYQPEGPAPTPVAGEGAEVTPPSETSETPTEGSEPSGRG